MVAGGHIKFGSASPTSVLPDVGAGNLKVIAVTGFRVPEFPDTPTAVEQGYPGVKAASGPVCRGRRSFLRHRDEMGGSYAQC